MQQCRYVGKSFSIYYGSFFNVESVSPGIIVATFNGTAKTTAVFCYRPNCSDTIEAVRFYSMLQDGIRQLQEHNVIIIVDDLNVQV